MSAKKVKLYIRIRSAEGRDIFAEPIWNRNRTLRGGYALVAGALEHHPEGIYYLRYARDGKRPWQAVGTDPDVALSCQRNAEHDLRSLALGRGTPDAAVLPAQPQKSTHPERPLSTAVDEYLQEVRLFRAPKTISACQNMLGKFALRFATKTVEDVTRKDLLVHMSALKEEGLGDRSVFNHISRITTLLKASGVEGLLRPADWPRYDEKQVSTYSTEELNSLLSTAKEDDRELFRFFLGTGFREQEVQHSTWANVDFSSKLISVWSKPEMGFRVKDKEERAVPVPDALIEMLAARKKRSTSILIFPSVGGKPDGHFLRKVQLAAYRAGLNCGECVTRNGKGCASSPVCCSWGLHKFRKTYATMHSEAGVSASTIQRWLGHSDLATTMLYLNVADMRSERTRSQVNAAFSGVVTEGEL